MSENIPFYNLQVPYDTLVHSDMLYLSDESVESLLKKAIEQRQWHRENNHPKAEVNLNFGPIAFTTKGCETTQHLIDKYHAARKEQELEKRKLREKFLKSNNNPQLKETATAFDKLNGEEMDEAVQKTSFANVLPLIEWFEKAAVMSDVAYHLFKNVCDTLDLNINAARLAAKLVEKGFPTYEQWNEQTRCPYGAEPPVMEEKYAVLSRIERYGICIASDIQFVSRPGTYMSHFWDSIQDYKEKLNAGKNAPRVIQKSHASNLRKLGRKPDTSRGDRTGGTSAMW